MKQLLIFITGLGIGAGATYYFMNQEYERELIIDEDDAEDIEDTKPKVHVEKLVKDYISNDEEAVQEAIKYHKAVAMDDEENESPESDWPYLIGEKMFKQENEFYEKKTLYYHAKDGVLTTEANIPFEHPEAAIDDYSFIEFDDFFDVNIPDVFYVRNDVQETDYEIYWLFEDSFTDLSKE